MTGQTDTRTPSEVQDTRYWLTPAGYAVLEQLEQQGRP